MAKPGMLSGLGLALVSSLGALAQAAVSPVPENVFRPDDRRPALDHELPARWVGRLINPSGGGCTATLVYRDLILTAAHCVIDKSTRSVAKGRYRFLLGLTRGRAVVESGVSRIWYGTTDTGAHRASDWALLRLKTPLGEKFGWIGVSAEDLGKRLDQDVVGIVGYGGGYLGGQTASIESGCRLTQVRSDGAILHDCDTLPGVSGAPMYVASRDAGGATHYYVVAINVASPKDARDKPYVGVAYSDDLANIAVPATSFWPTLKRLLGR